MDYGRFVFIAQFQDTSKSWIISRFRFSDEIDATMDILHRCFLFGVELMLGPLL